jgi:peptidoglycan/xylan/chitin deacetylase (PgdA/CDA1 family)
LLLFLLIFFTVLVFGVLYVFWVAPLWFLPVLEWLTPGVLFRVRTSEPLVALSFDDGPHPEFTPRVLEILQQHQARATFFLIGERAARRPALVDAILAAGHELGNHCWRDGPIVKLTDEDFARSLDQTAEVLHRVPGSLGTPITRLAAGSATGAAAEPSSPQATSPPTGTSHGAEHQPTVPSRVPAALRAQSSAPLKTFSQPKFFRAPGGVAWPRQWRLARQRGYLGVLGCAYPHDPMHPPIWYIRWLINKNLRPGTIVILHDGIKDPSRTVAALPAILEQGRRRGFTFVTIGDLLTRVVAGL